MAFSLTEEQRAAVEDRGGGVLVSAAAGSGKTKVLVERLLRRVAEEGAQIDSFLVITYTRAAAAELRARVSAALSERLAERPGDAHLRRQLTLVYKAQISTVHAFCSALLKECGHLLDLAPDARLCDEGESRVLMAEALDRVMEARYEDLDPAGGFASLVDTMAAGRDDSRLMEIVLNIYGKIQSHPRPERWLVRQRDVFALRDVEDVGKTPWGALLLEDTRRQAAYWQNRMSSALRRAEGDPKMEKAYAPSLRQTLGALEALQQAAGLGWDAAGGFADLPFPRMGPVRGCDDPDGQSLVKAIRDRCKTRMGKCAERFQRSSAALLDDMRALAPAMTALVSLVEDFGAAYAAEKRRRGLLDFSDLEHLAARLLVEEDGTPTPLAGQWGARYTEIMVDEYQDTNEVQNAIFTALSDRGRNLFLVGDVKQSIYRFRLADPGIFLEKYRSFRPWGEAGPGEDRRIILSRNFRSRPQILEGVNDLFRAVMSTSFGEMDYTDAECLYPGGTFAPLEDAAVELCVLDLEEQQEGETEKTDKNLLEARTVARRIRGMLEGGAQVSEGEGGVRPMRPGDIVILLRSPGTVLHHYIRALHEEDLPWETQGAGDFFSATEVSVALSLLQIIDNPRQDVPLISVLRSPVYQFSADRLAALRAGQEGDFYDAVAAGARRGEPDCAAFLEQLTELRLGAGDMSSHQLIWRLYDLCNLPGLFSMLPSGEERREKLLTLYELARRFEENGHRGLYAFLTHLRRLREHGIPVLPQTPGEGGGVRILSIHRSKGLEFPVVFLCGLARRLNREDMQRPILFHQTLGMGPKGLDTARMIEYTTLAREAVRHQLESEMMAEELRLLYVAMTRAKDKLVMTCALPGGREELRRLGLEAGSPVDPEALRACSSVGQWILLAALARPEAAELRDWADMPPPGGALPFGPPWRIARVDIAPLETAGCRPAPEAAVEEEAPPDEGLLERLGWRYPYPALAQIPSKLTATGLKGRFLDQEAEEEAVPVQAETAPRQSAIRRPVFAQEALGLTAAQRGTAVHLVMQHLDFARTGSPAEIAAQVEELAARRLITPQQGETVDCGNIARLFASPLGRELRESGTVRREFKFSVLLPASDYYPQAPAGEEILLQGVIDAWMETPEGIALVDFKTDRVSAAQAPAKAEEYRGQLDAYARALEELTGQPVRRRVLWFFFPGTAVALP